MVTLRAPYRTRLACTLLAGAVVMATSITPRAQALDTLELGALLAEVDASPTVRAARLAADAARAGARATGFRPDPEVEVMLRSAAFTSPEGERGGLTVRQMLPYPSALRAERAAAVARAEAGAAGAAVVAADLHLAVRRAYYALYRAQERERIVRAFQRRVGAFAEAAAVRYEVGRGPQGAILQAQLAEGRFEEERRTLATEREVALARLSALVGRPALASAGGAAVVALPPPPEADSALVALALAGRPELAALAAEARTAEAEVERARLAFRPELGVSAGVYNMAGPMDDGRNVVSVGVMVRVPLNRDRLQARLDEARLLRAVVGARREAVEVEIAAGLAQLVTAARREAETLDLYRARLMPQAEATVESLLAAYSTGQADLLDLLDAERTRFELAVGAEEARYRYLVALAELARAVGGAGATAPEATAPETP